MPDDHAAVLDPPPRRLWSLSLPTRRRVTSFAFLLPALAVLTVLFALPLLRLLQLSLEGSEGITFSHYSEFVSSSAYMKVVLSTFQIAAIVTVLCLLIGYPVAYFLAHASGRAKRFVLVPVLAALSLSILARTYAWVVLLQREGIVNSTLDSIGLTGQPLELIYNRFGVYVGMVHILLPFMIVALVPVLSAINPALVTAARSLGARPSVAFIKVYLPLSLPGVVAGSTLVFVMALGFFITPAILGGGNSTMIAQVVQTQVQEVLDWNLAAAMSIALLAVSLAGLFVYDRFASVDRMFGRQP